MSRQTTNSVLTIFFIILVLNVVFGGFATEYVVEYWGAYFKDVPVDVPLWACFVAGIFIGQFTIPVAVLTWLISFLM